MNAIKVSNLSKKFTHYPTQRDRLFDLVSGGRAQKGVDFWALKDISFEVPQGTAFGIIGQNGSGKSTLLSILAGVLQPTSGTFTVNGKVAAILELGSGFHHEFTGRENIYMYGAILGLSRAEIGRRFDEIVDFSELHEFIDRPLYTYSSGMVVRLAFSVAVNVDADILIIDEALAVGDILFQMKCLEKINKIIIKKETTFILVSHDAGVVKKNCDEAIYLKHGLAAHIGKVENVVEMYMLDVRNQQNIEYGKNSVGIKKSLGDNLAFGCDDGNFISAVFTKTKSQYACFRKNDIIEIDIAMEWTSAIVKPLFSIMVNNSKMFALCGNSFIIQKMRSFDSCFRSFVICSFKGNFFEGRYFITLRLEDQVAPNDIILIEKQAAVLIFDVISGGPAMAGQIEMELEMLFKESKPL